MADLIKREDDLNTGREKLNEAIKDSNKARQDSSEALQTANQSLAMSENTQTQLDTIVIEGDSSVEAAQARVDAEGKSYPTLKARLDEKETQFSSQLAQIEKFESFEVNDKGRGLNKQGITVFITDDGGQHDYSVLYPLFSRNNVPFCIAAVPEFMMGTNSYMSVAEMLEVQNAGNEIISHTFSHPRLPTLSDEEAENEFKASKEWFAQNGFDVKNFALPFGDWGLREKYLAKKYYRSMRISTQGENKTPVEMHELKSHWLGEGRHGSRDTESGEWHDTFEYYKYYIDKAHENKSLLIISMHGSRIFHGNHEDLLEQVVQYAKTKTEVLTLNDALNNYGNLIEVGDFTRNDPTKAHFAVGFDGEIHSNHIPTKFLGHDIEMDYDNLENYPRNEISIHTISNNHASNLGFSVGGTLYTERRIGGATDTFTKQVYKTVTGKEFVRTFNTTLGEWIAWVEVQTERTIHYLGRNPSDMNPNQFENGITLAEMTGAHVQESDFPGTSSGLLTTYKMNSSSYVYQEFHNVRNQKYVRQAVNDTSWGAWENYSKAQAYTTDEKTEATLIDEYDLGISILRVRNWSIGNGIVTTYKVGSNQYDKQEFRKSATNELYSRVTTSSGSWGSWELINT